MMNGPSSARGMLAAGCSLLAAHEKAVTFCWSGGMEKSDIFGCTEGTLVVCFKDTATAAVSPGFSQTFYRIRYIMSLAPYMTKSMGGLRIFSHCSILI